MTVLSDLVISILGGPDAPLDEPVDVEGVARILGTSAQAVRRLIRAGKLQAVRLHDNPRAPFVTTRRMVGAYLHVLAAAGRRHGGGSRRGVTH